jgi:large subunit ribosomal protein L23Ae
MNTKNKAAIKKLKNPTFPKKKISKFSLKFFRPKTKTLKKTPKFSKKLFKKKRKSFLKIIKYPLACDSTLIKIQYANTLVFIVDVSSNKYKIKNTIKKLFKIKVKKINTLVKLNGKKKAFIKLPSDVDALEIANKIGII